MYLFNITSGDVWVIQVTPTPRCRQLGAKKVSFTGCHSGKL